jgi:hypothetical protein
VLGGFLQNEHQRDHSQAKYAEDPENVDERQHGRLSLHFSVQERLRLFRSLNRI